MTDQHDNNDTERNSTETTMTDGGAKSEQDGEGIRRRTMIAATLGSPALIGLGFGAADRLALPGPGSATMSGAASPVEQAMAGSSIQAQMDSATAEMGEEVAQNVPMNQFRSLRANDEVLDTLEREVGDQVLVTRENDMAVFTLVEPLEEDEIEDEEDDPEDENGVQDDEEDENGMEDDEEDENGVQDDEEDENGMEDDEEDENGLEDDEDDENGIEDEEEDEMEADGAIVQASAEGKCRIAFFEDEEFEDDRRWGPLRGDETCNLVDEAFEVEIDPRVPMEDTDVDEAAEAGGLIETFAEGDTAMAVLAPAGGQIQPFTDEQAELVIEQFGATGWMMQGYGQDTSFYRWHVPSAEISFASFPELAALAEETYDYAVSFHGINDDTIYVGGAADEELRSEIVSAIENVLPHDGSPVQLAEHRYAADSPNTLVNRITDDEASGIWIGQPIADRRNSWDEIAAAVASVVVEEAGLDEDPDTEPEDDPDDEDENGLDDDDDDNGMEDDENGVGDDDNGMDGEDDENGANGS